MQEALSTAKRVALFGILGALTIALSLLEGLLPPLPSLPPGAKLGLANIIVLLAACQAGLPSALLLTLLKGAAVFLSRGATACFMSLSGGILSTLIVCLLFSLPKRPFGLAGISVAGAICHNLGQLLCSRVLMGTPAVWAYTPALLLFALPAGLLTGTVFRLLLPVLRRSPLAGWGRSPSNTTASTTAKNPLCRIRSGKR